MLFGITSSLQFKKCNLDGEKWIQHDIMYIKDFLSDNSNFLSHQEINDKYNVGCKFLNILQLRQSIPFIWREAVHGTDVKNIHIIRNSITLTDQNGNMLDIRHVNCKTQYWIFVCKKLRQPSCINKWTTYNSVKLLKANERIIKVVSRQTAHKNFPLPLPPPNPCTHYKPSTTILM